MNKADKGLEDYPKLQIKDLTQNGTGVDFRCRSTKFMGPKPPPSPQQHKQPQV